MSEIFKKLAKYNFWQRGIRIEIGYKRQDYLKKVKKHLGNKLIKVILGQRRVGKSYLLRQIIDLLLQQRIIPKNIFYLNKELVDFDEVKDYKDLDQLIKLYKKTLKVKGKVYILLDEVQEISGWEKIVNSLSQNYRDQYELFITGSNSTLLSSELASFISGRYTSILVYPFSFTEYTDFFKMPRNKEEYLKYLTLGGLPELYHLKDEEIRRHYLISLLNTIILKDIVQRYTIRDTLLLENLFKFLANNIGSLFSVKAIVDYLNNQGLKTNIETLSNYLLYLEQTYLLHSVDRYDIRGKKIFTTHKKYYLNDLAFRFYLSSQYTPDIGRYLENAVYLHYLAQGYKIYVGNLYRTEIDFVLEKDKERKYIQVAYLLSDKKIIGREFGNLEKIKDAYEKLVISLDDVKFENAKGIKHLRPWEL